MLLFNRVRFSRPRSSNSPLFSSAPAKVNKGSGLDPSTPKQPIQPHGWCTKYEKKTAVKTAITQTFQQNAFLSLVWRCQLYSRGKKIIPQGHIVAHLIEQVTHFPEAIARAGVQVPAWRYPLLSLLSCLY